MLIKLADISAPTKPKDLHFKWTERIVEEFYVQVISGKNSRNFQNIYFRGTTRKSWECLFPCTWIDYSLTLPNYKIHSLVNSSFFQKFLTQRFLQNISSHLSSTPCPMQVYCQFKVFDCILILMGFKRKKFSEGKEESELKTNILANHQYWLDQIEPPLKELNPVATVIFLQLHLHIAPPLYSGQPLHRSHSKFGQWSLSTSSFSTSSGQYLVRSLGSIPEL